MPAVEVIGWLAAGVGAATMVPQLVKLVRTGNSAGVSLLAWQTLVTIGIGWCSHGVIVGAPNMIIVNAWMVLASLLVIRAVRRDRGLSWTVYLLPLSLGAVLVAVDLLFGPVAYAVLAVIPGAIGTWGQLAEIVRTRDLSGLSPGYLVLAALTQGLWLTWALGEGEVSTQISSTVLGVSLVVSCLWYLARRLGLPALWAQRRPERTGGTP